MNVLEGLLQGLLLLVAVVLGGFIRSGVWGMIYPRGPRPRSPKRTRSRPKN